DHVHNARYEIRHLANCIFRDRDFTWASEEVKERLNVAYNCLYVPNLTPKQRAQLDNDVFNLECEYGRLEYALKERKERNAFNKALRAPFYFAVPAMKFISPEAAVCTFLLVEVIRPYLKDQHYILASANDKTVKYDMPKIHSAVHDMNARRHELVQINK